MDNSSSQKVNKRTNGIAESSTYLCVICDITVPNIYWKSHNDSLKHKTCLEIANVSMQRVRKNMFTVPPHYSTSDSNYYFCGACAVPIAVTEKIYHTSTKEHADAVKHDELLSNLLDIYKNKSKLSNNDTTISTVHVHAKNKNNNTTEVNRTKDRNQVIKVKPDNNVCAINITSEDNNKNRELYVLKEHIDYVNEKLEAQAYLYILKNKYLNISIDSSLLQIDIRNFNGIKMYPEYKKWRCLLCGDWLNTEADIVTHCQNRNHIKNITGPLRDKQCIRKIDAEIQANNDFYHCIICNKRMHEVLIDYHIVAEDHIMRVEQSLIYKMDATCDNITCRICELSVYVYNFASHEKRKEHLMNLNIRRA